MPAMPSATATPTLRDADYDAAIDTVRHAIDRFSGCSEEERATLERDLEQLHDMVEKLEAGRVEIVVFGEISTGKCADQRLGGRRGHAGECPRRLDQGRLARARSGRATACRASPTPKSC